MKRLVLLGEGHGEVSALPILIGRLLTECGLQNSLFVDRDVIRTSPAHLVRWNKANQEVDYTRWVSRVELAARRRDVGGVLAVYDGDYKKFPVGSTSVFCASTAAKGMAASAISAGAGRVFSLSVVFACPEYETWLVAGAESFLGRRLQDGRILLEADAAIPSGDHETRGKGWLERNCGSYRPTRDQMALTELLDFRIVRTRELRSFERLEHALKQLSEAAASSHHISTPV